MIKELVVLTSSLKHGGRCVACVDMNEKRFYRLVSDINGSSISNELMENINLLDLIRVKVIKSCPIKCQTENILIDLEYGIEKITDKAYSIAEVYELVGFNSKEKNILGSDASYVRSVDGLRHSLDLILVNNLEYYYDYMGKTKVKFMHNQFFYDGCFPTSFEKQFNYQHGMQKTIAKFNEAYIVVSIAANAYPDENGVYYKFVAAVYPK